MVSLTVLGRLEKQALRPVQAVQAGTESDVKTPGKYGIAALQRMTRMFLIPRKK